jgi:putative membrane protein
LNPAVASGKISIMPEDNISNDRDLQKPSIPMLAVRSGIGGGLMGLANLVPGISGGTMLLAAGVYPNFINAIAEVTTFRFKRRSIVILGCVLAAAALAVLLWAGPIKDLVVNRRWIMYSLFIGLTLGGIPIVWRMADHHDKGMWIGTACGLLGMVALFVMQVTGFATQAGGKAQYAMLFLSGAVGAGAMILPGVSGGYLLLVLGQYVPILSAIDQFKEALEAGDAAAAVDVALNVGLPVGLGVALGVVGISNLVRMLLSRYRTQTLGVLLGLLLGAVIGLWPFQQGIRPEIGDTIKGRIMTAELISGLEPEDYPIDYFPPRGTQIVGATVLLLAGFGITSAISRIGGKQG